MNWKKISLMSLGIIAFSTGIYAQQAPENWFNLDQVQDKVQGVSTEKAYKELLTGKKPQKVVVVAVIDSGVDPDHEDLKDIMWVNEKEIPNNGKDDDGNGYVDDIHGWNFIGGKDGKNVNQETLEMTRIYRELKAKETRSSYEEKYYKMLREEIETKVTQMKILKANYDMIKESLVTLKDHLGRDDFKTGDLSGVGSEAPAKVVKAKDLVGAYLKEATCAEFLESVEEGLEYFNGQLNFNLNVDFDPRNIIGDDYSNQTEHLYGNNDVYGPDAVHGTHVAGIIGAIRGNGVGMDGVANNIRIMSVRTVPNGDERDKDVANAIRYAVDNGADVVNMSFGKAYSYNKKIVDAAVKYAEKKGVLLVHAAGNDNKNIDEEDNFPTKFYQVSKKDPTKRGTKVAKNWIEVGALSWKPGEDAPAVFSNYGKATVDLFAPGVDLYSTLPENEYKPLSGTSMAAPVVAGVAALVKSYYPTLTAAQLKECLEKSVVPMDTYVKVPGSLKKVAFKELCITSGVVNAYNALKLAEKMTQQP